MIAKLLYYSAKRYNIAKCFPLDKRKIAMEATKDLDGATLKTLEDLIQIKTEIDLTISSLIFSASEEKIRHIQGLSNSVKKISKTLPSLLSNEKPD